MLSRFKSTVKTALMAIATVAYASSYTYAGTITIGDAYVTNSHRFENFDKGVIENNVTNQFSSNGLTFTTTGQAGIALTSNIFCSNFAVTNQYLYMGATNDYSTCVYDYAAENSISILFDDSISELSWRGFSRVYGLGYTVQALLDGSIVSTFNMNSNNVFENKYVYFSGDVFNEIRITENGVAQGFFAIDDMTWRLDSNAEVPLPGTVSLMGLGLVGLGLMRKKAKC